MSPALLNFHDTIVAEPMDTNYCLICSTCAHTKYLQANGDYCLGTYVTLGMPRNSDMAIVCVDDNYDNK